MALLSGEVETLQAQPIGYAEAETEVPDGFAIRGS